MDFEGRIFDLRDDYMNYKGSEIHHDSGKVLTDAEGVQSWKRYCAQWFRDHVGKITTGPDLRHWANVNDHLNIKFL